MRHLLAASAIALLIASPAFAQSAPSGDKADKSKNLDAMHSEALVEMAKSGYADAPVDEKQVTRAEVYRQCRDAHHPRRCRQASREHFLHGLHS
jgi:hypothetical protein